MNTSILSIILCLQNHLVIIETGLSSHSDSSPWLPWQSDSGIHWASLYAVLGNINVENGFYYFYLKNAFLTFLFFNVFLVAKILFLLNLLNSYNIIKRL